MATTTAEAGPAPGTERLRRLSLTQRILARPAAGALIIVVFVWLVFAAISLAKGNLAFIAPSGTLNYLDVAAQVGIVGTAVALLMIAGEFDLSIGSLVGFAGIVIGIGVTIWGLPVWLSILMSMVATTLLGVLNGIIVVRTGPAVVHRHPRDAVHHPRLLLGADLASSRTSPTSRSIATADRERPDRRPVQLEHRRRRWRVPQGLDPVVARSSPSSASYVLGRTRFGNWIAGVGGSATARAQPRRPGRPGQDLALRADGVLRLDPGDDPEHDLLLGRHPARHRHRARRHHDRGHRRHAADRRLRLRRGTALGALSLGMARQGIVFADINADWYKIAIGTLLLVAVVLNNWIRRRFAGL